VVDFELGYGQPMQLIIATAQSLDDYTEFGVYHLLSDTRHFGPSDESLKHTAAIDDGVGLIFFYSMRRVQKCGAYG